MRETDAWLLEGRPPRAVFLPTAAAEEGEERVDYWLDLGTAHYESMGVEPVPLRVLTRDDADDEAMAAAIEGAGLVYLSGGDPGYLAETLRGTAVWRAIVAAHENDVAVAGCSAGACALTAIANRVRRRAGEPGPGGGKGLELVPGMVVIPHFDRIEAWAPGIVDNTLAAAPAGSTVIGIDEETSLCGGPQSFFVSGQKSVWVIDADGGRHRRKAGDSLEL